jgi:putative transposase
VQLSLHPRRNRTWGGAREGAGRPAAKQRKTMPHRARPEHNARHPVHVTLRVIRGLPNLRHLKTAGPIGEAIRDASRDAERAHTFRVIEFSIQPDHLHLIAEAASADALARGLQGLASRIARRTNRALRRTGSLFAERYHVRPLATPREVRNALVYVLTNFRKHFGPRADTDETCDALGVDVCSSARWFAGWRDRREVDLSLSPVRLPRTWLAARGWRLHGLIDSGEKPRGD